MLERIKEYVKAVQTEAIPQLSINCVIFGFHDKKLMVIVNKVDLGKKVLTVLPGGYIQQKEDVSAAVQRIVRDSTGLEKILFSQFSVFGDTSRSFEKEFTDLAEQFSISDLEALKWWTKRFVTICYLALVDFNKIKLQPTQFMEAAEWLPIEKAKVLAMDHSEIVKSARESLAKELPHTPIASNLLPKKFTLPDLQALVEAIIGKTIDRPNFRRKILNSDLIVKVGQDNSGKRRPADLYSFKHKSATLF
jgi:8-oxo-dGTP diphosphatase